MAEKKSILDILKKYIADQNNFPVLNPNAVKLQNEVLKTDPDLEAVKKLIYMDPTLTSELLKLANSPYYIGLGEVSTIKEAALRMGQDEVFNMIMQVIHKHNFSSRLPLIKTLQNQLWDHSVACGFASLWLTRHLKLTELVSRAFIAGLLHDMGKLGLLTALEKIMTRETKKIRLPPDLITKILSKLHTKQGYALLVQWHLPDVYCRIARDHHADEYDESNILLVVVRLANMVCEKADRNDSDEDLSYIIGSKEADILGLGETGLALLEIAMEDAGLLPKR